MSIKIRPLEPNDFPQWLPLWDGNNLGQRKEDVTAETWSRLNDPASQVNGLCALENGAMVGLVHYIEHSVTGHIKPVCYMQDVYVDLAHRQKGIAKKLVHTLAEMGKREKKWARIQWMAEANNEAAQALYKNLGVNIDFTLHILPLD